MSEPMPVRTRGQATPALVEKKGQYLAFQLGGETFAMPIGSIKEVIQYGELTVVPLMPDFVRGVINLRGAVVPVLDLSTRFGRAGTEVGRRTCIVIVETADLELGLLVDTVSEVLEIAAAEIERPPALGHNPRAGFLAGIGKVGGGFVLLLDVDKVLDLEERTALAEAAATQG